MKVSTATLCIIAILQGTPPFSQQRSVPTDDIVPTKAGKIKLKTQNGQGLSNVAPINGPVAIDPGNMQRKRSSAPFGSAIETEYGQSRILRDHGQGNLIRLLLYN